MKFRYFGIFIFLLVAATAVATYSYMPDYLIRKMENQLYKIYSKEVTYSELPLADSAATNNQLFKISSNDTLAGYSIITRALGCKIGGCDKPSDDSISFEQFYFLTTFDKQKAIKKIRVLEYTADHGYQIASKAWLKQFEGNENFEVGKNVDAISGATISVNSITKEVNNQLNIIRLY